MKTNRLPNFLIVGTMKSGTSSLADYLSEHVDIHIPNKEVHYFNNDINYNKGFSWYEAQLFKDFDEDSKSNHPIVGEKTPTYSYQPNCVDRIKETVPEVKLIWIFRNPVKRSFSNYIHAVRKGAEPLSFNECVKNEELLIRDNMFRGYVERSKYSDQVERFLEKFDLNNMHFLLFEDLIREPKKELNKIADFLGVPNFKNIKTVHSNKTKLPKRTTKLGETFGGLDGFLYKIIRRMNLKLAHDIFIDQLTLSQKNSAELAHKFKPYNQRLSELTGLDLSVWDEKNL